MNPQGITFGASAQVDVAGLVASTLGVKDEAMTSSGPVLALSGPDAALAQHGAIRVKAGGVLTLLSGKGMTQSGTLTAPAGAIHRAAAERVSLDASGTTTDPMTDVKQPTTRERPAPERPSFLPLAARRARDCARQADLRLAACDDHVREAEGQIVPVGARHAGAGIRLPAEAQAPRPSP